MFFILNLIYGDIMNNNPNETNNTNTVINNTEVTVVDNTAKPIKKISNKGPIIAFVIIMLIGSVVVLFKDDFFKKEVPIIENNTVVENNNETEEVDEIDNHVYEWKDDATEGTVVTVISKNDCYFCSTYEPVIKKLANDMGFKLYYFVSDDLLSGEYDMITSSFNNKFRGSFPYTFIVSEGKFIGEYTGYTTESEIKSFLTSHLSLEEDELEEPVKKINKTKTLYNKNINLNGKDVNIKLVGKFKSNDEWLDGTYTILFDGKESLSIEDSLYDFDESVKFTYVKDISKIVDNNNKEYIVVNIDIPDETGIEHYFVLINDEGKALLEFNQYISSFVYEISGANSSRYLLNDNNCKTYFADWVCKDIKKIYSTYTIDSDKIYFLDCKEDENILYEHTLQIKDGVVELIDSEDKYNISNLDQLSGGGFSCPNYNKK